MDLEMSVSDTRSKRRVLRLLTECGYTATSGSIRMAHPFTVLVTGLRDDDVNVVHRIVVSADPGAGRLHRPTRPLTAA